MAGDAPRRHGWRARGREVGGWRAGACARKRKKRMRLSALSLSLSLSLSPPPFKKKNSTACSQTPTPPRPARHASRAPGGTGRRQSPRPARSRAGRARPGPHRRGGSRRAGRPGRRGRRGTRGRRRRPRRGGVGVGVAGRASWCAGGVRREKKRGVRGWACPVHCARARGREGGCLGDVFLHYPKAPCGSSVPPRRCACRACLASDLGGE